jgi:hypothetical protein
MTTLAFFLAALVGVAPTPSPTPLPMIAHVKATPLCSTVANNVFYTIGGLRINDKLIANTKPLLIEMGKAYEQSSGVGARFDKQQAAWGNTAGGTHETNTGLVLGNQRLVRLADELVHNLDMIDGILNDPTRFPAVAKTDDDKKALALKAQLQAVADQQRKNLNVLYGLGDTFSLQDLIAKGDQTQGAINGGGQQQVSHNDQDVSFQDVLSGVDRGQSGHATDPGLSQDPSITQSATDLTNNPMARFFVEVAQNEDATGLAENALTATVISTIKGCRR